MTITLADFNQIFSMPREPETALGPGQNFELKIPKGKKVLVTDVYIENLGGGRSTFRILEQRLPNSFEVRYTFRTASGQTTIVNFTSGLKLGDEVAIAGSIRIENESGSQASIVPRVNGVIIG